MKKFLLVLSIVIICIILGGYFSRASILAWLYRTRSVSDPLVIESEETIKETLLALTPVGMNKEGVLHVIDSQEKWAIMRVNYDRGFALVDIGIPFPDEYASDMHPVIGEKFIRVKIGDYVERFHTTVSVYWAFDSNERLIDLYARKDYK